MSRRPQAPHAIQWRASGYGIQKVPALKFWKIWWWGRVVDRALTKQAALRRIREWEKDGPLFGTHILND